MANFAATWTLRSAIASIFVAAVLFTFGQVRFGALALSLTFFAIATARLQGVLPATFRIRRARTDVVMALVLAVALATLAIALPLGR